MSGIRWLFISKDYKVYRIPKPKKHVYKPIKDLSGQEVLEVILYYETRDRKPFKLLTVHFDRLSLNAEGRYMMSDEDRDRSFYNVFEFGIGTPEELAKRDKPLAIPIAPVTPSSAEKEALYTYLGEELPELAKDAPIIVEKLIGYSKESHQKNINLIKQSKRLKEAKYE